MIVDKIDIVADKPKPMTERMEKRFLDFFKLFIAKISPITRQNDDINKRHLEITMLLAEIKSVIRKIEKGIITVKIKSKLK